ILLTSFIKGDSETIKDIYLNGRLGNITEIYKDHDLDKKSLDFQLLYLEALIRTGEKERADKLFEKIKNIAGNKFDIHVLEGMRHLSRGDLISSADSINSISKEKLSSVSLIQLRYFNELYKRDFSAAGSLLNTLLDHKSGFGKSNLFFLLALEFYRSAMDFEKLSSLYRKKMKGIKKRDNRNYYANLKLNHKLYKRKPGVYFRIESAKERVEIPFESGNKGALKSIVLKKGNKKFSILLDTGNTSGWLIHSRDLREELKSLRGGRTVMQVGTESGKLDGFNIFCRILDFEEFTLSGLYGNYIPKPRQDFFDANLNPAMIRNRIVSLDFINNRLILRTRERFFADIEQPGKMEVMKIPWFGHKYPMVPVLCNSKNGLAIIETGAENISIESDFAVELGIPLTERSKYLSNGKIFKYSLGSVNVQLGKYLFVRDKAEVWPLKRFRNHLTGFAPHVIIGPEALEGKFVVSFIPEENILVFEYERKN
ncbi:MAG: hypothetical protein KAS21_09515, partial [Candidatus Aminicenantes bacterium]|nr:hypothetical protein [Candidatus Aminicenantes bacterium]